MTSNRLPTRPPTPVPSAPFARRLFDDEGGGEVMETALVMALICIAAIAVIVAVAANLSGRWRHVSDTVQ